MCGRLRGHLAGGCDNGAVKAHEQFVSTIARKFGLQVSRIGSNEGRLPVEATSDDATLITALRPYTMTSAERLWSLINAVSYATAAR